MTSSASSSLAIVLALVAAALFACAAVAQQSAAAAVPDGALVRGVLRSGRWWAGVGGDLGGYLVQVAALAVGSVAVVQPVLVSMLLFALPLSARFSGLRMRPSTWVAAVGLTAALVIFVAVGEPTEGDADAPWSAWAAPLAVVVGIALVAAAVGVSARRRASRAALSFGIAGGLLFGVAVAFTKYVTDLVERGLLVAATSVADGVAGFCRRQRAFQAGPLAASLPAVTIGEPLAAVALGVVVLQERIDVGGVRGPVVIAALAVMIVTTIALSRVQATAGEPQTARSPDGVPPAVG
ncbi:DMT family transporter [Rhodococcoides kroppenstedtii]|uniref:DMT family transporter n=1 Tax=Rhodococcoides kroppenstedtii TaxID=293050 RepID=UPI000838BDAB|nr:DMT family transporter [Rhodococcus kroppenstedtii]